MKCVKIGDRVIGNNNPPFFVAELGICHEGSLNVAIELTKAAVEAGAHCIKTEAFQRRKIVFHSSAMMDYSIKGKEYSVSQEEHMDKYQLCIDDHCQIKKLCDKLKVPFMATAHDFETVDMLEDIGASAIKIASPDIVHYPLLQYVAKKKLPVFLDTGSSYQFEVEMALKVLQDEGLKDIIINHNPSGHPAPAEQQDLRIIQGLKCVTDFPVGITDHYEGYDMVYAAVAMGADSIEKPISLDRFVTEPERNMSISIGDLKNVLKKMNEVFSSLGQRQRTTMSESGERYRFNNRMSCIASSDLSIGSEINFENVTFGRPHIGIGVEHWDLIAGRKLTRPVKANEFIHWGDVD